jgi:hypothetical protein
MQQVELSSVTRSDHSCDNMWSSGEAGALSGPGKQRLNQQRSDLVD